MKNTIELLKKQHDVLVDVIVWMDQNKKSNTEIRSKVDIILNHEKKLEEASEMELTKITYVG
jgi:ribulose kinase